MLIQATALLAANLPELDDLSLLEYEMGVDRASTVAHILDKADAFGKVYTTFDAWVAAACGFCAALRWSCMYSVSGTDIYTYCLPGPAMLTLAGPVDVICVRTELYDWGVRAAALESSAATSPFLWQPSGLLAELVLVYLT